VEISTRDSSHIPLANRRNKNGSQPIACFGCQSNLNTTIAMEPRTQAILEGLTLFRHYVYQKPRLSSIQAGQATWILWMPAKKAALSADSKPGSNHASTPSWLNSPGLRGTSSGSGCWQARQGENFFALRIWIARPTDSRETGESLRERSLTRGRTNRRHTHRCWIGIWLHGRLTGSAFS
jgi:hypothetical protein